MRLEQAYGHEISLDAYRRDPAALSERLAQSGLETLLTSLRNPSPPEKVQQCYLLAHKPA